MASAGGRMTPSPPISRRSLFLGGPLRRTCGIAPFSKRSMARDVTPPPQVVCASLAKTFAGRTEAVHPIDLTFTAGRTTALVGPCGCGKSTLLRMVAGLESPSAGTVEIGGAPPAATLRRAGLSVAFQDPSLLPWRSVRGNMELALTLARRRVE